MIAFNIIREIESKIKQYANVGVHPQDRNRVGNQLPFVLIRKGNERSADRQAKGKICKDMDVELMLITENLYLKDIIKLQNEIESAVLSIQNFEGLHCIVWNSVEEPPANQSMDSFSFDRPNILGNKQLKLIRFTAMINQER